MTASKTGDAEQDAPLTMSFYPHIHAAAVVSHARRFVIDSQIDRTAHVLFDFEQTVAAHQEVINLSRKPLGLTGEDRANILEESCPCEAGIGPEATAFCRTDSASQEARQCEA
jgi:hypothetical protein